MAPMVKRKKKATGRAKEAELRAENLLTALRSNLIVYHILHDEKFRESVHKAADAAQDAYKRLRNGRPTVDALIDDKRLHKDMKRTAESVRDALYLMREDPKKKARRRRRRMLVLIVGGAAAVVIVNEGARKKLMDKIFGSEEEFQYTSTTTPVGATAPPPPPPPPPAAASEPATEAAPETEEPPSA